MTINFQAEPFFDDYSEDKQFYRILYRPGYAVQARELTQMQTILQEQVKRHGDHIFKEGSLVIPGQISYDLDVAFVKLLTPENVNTESVLSNLVGRVIRNDLGVTAKVLTYERASSSSDPFDTIFVKFLSSAQYVDVADGQTKDMKVFRSQESLYPEDGTTGLTVEVAEDDVANNPISVGPSSLAMIQRGVYYIKKHFVLVKEQTIVLDKFSNQPTYRIGLYLQEDVVYPEQDESLLDNSTGSPNYAAPGASRYYIDLQLVKLDPEVDTDENFIDLMRLENGRVIHKIDRSQYAELEKTLARRTYDESGDYALNPFSIQVREYRNNFRGDWHTNTVYIQGDIIRRPGVTNAKDYFVATTNGVSSSSAEAVNWSITTDFVEDGIAGSKIIWEYITVPEFNRGVYTFNSNDTKYANFTENDHIRLNGMLAIGIEKNKAYVRGYEIEKLATEYLMMEKSRDLPAGSVFLADYLNAGTEGLPAKTTAISTEKTVTIEGSTGAYVIANNAKFAPDIVQFSLVKLRPATVATVTAGAANANAAIGTARIRGFEKHSDTGQYKVFLFDIKMNAGYDFSQVRSIKEVAGGGTDTSFRCDFVLENGIAVLKDPNKNSLIYTLPNYAIKDILELDYFVSVRLSGTASAGVVSYPLSTGLSWASTANPQNYMLIRVSGASTGMGDIITNPTATINGQNLVVSGLTNGSEYVLLGTAQVANAETNFSHECELIDDFDNFVTEGEATQRVITIDQSYVTRIVSVMMNPNGFIAGNYTENITNRYVFDNGQTTSALNKGTLELKPGSKVPTGAIQVKYEYINTGVAAAQKVICSNSFTYSDDSRIPYYQIPTINGLALRDCLDFRPFYLSTGGAFETKYLPKYGYNISVKYNHYLPRIDNIALTSTGKYVVTQGIPSIASSEPNIPDNSMKIARFSLEPYTFTASETSVRIDKVENKRYTMRDIGKLERRIKDLEYYTSLSLLELDTKNSKITDSAGFDRLQNGFIVDNFVDQSIGNVSSSEWNASVDSANSELRPFFSQKQIYLLENVNTPSRQYKVSGDIVTQPYTEVSMISQLKASTTENVNPYALYAWKGIIGLNPWSDTWFSTERRPDIIINDEGQYNAIVAKAEEDGVLGTAWNSWQTMFSSSTSLGSRLENLTKWSSANTAVLNDSNNGGTFWRARSTFTADELNQIGITDGGANLWSQQAWAVAGSRVLTIETSAVETTSSRQGVRTFVVDKVDSRVLDDRVVETRVVPWIRSRSVLFTGFGFKPNTTMYAFFDGTDVTSYITKAVRLKVARVQTSTGGYFPHRFDTFRNAGSAVENPERLVVNGALEDVEIAFNHGEIVREENGNGRTAIVVGQETVGNDFYIYVMNVKTSAGQPDDTNGFSLAAGSYLKGEYLTSSGDYSRVRVLQVMPAGTGFVSSPTGVVFGIFKIPNDPIMRFRTGTREFKLTDDSSNNDLAASSTGSTFYEANGLIEVKQRTILSTRTAELVSEQVSEENTVVTTNERLTRDTGWFDPLAQTFLVQKENGAFITSVDLYFSTIDENVPVRIEIREVVNGYPGSKVLPFSRVEKKGSDITTSSNGSVSTNFKFQSPVYLQNGAEYALVVLSDSNQYRIFISQTDTIDLITNARISSQPYNGVLFKSQNGSTWTADQTQDMKFTIYNASFDTSPKTIEFVTSSIPKKNLATNPFMFKKRSKKIRVTHTNHGMKAGDIVELVGNQVYSGNAIKGIPTSEIFTSHEILSATLDTYVIEVTTAASSDGADGGSFVYASEYYSYQTAMIDIGQIEIPGTAIEYTIKTTADTVGATLASTGNLLIPKENYTFSEGKVLKEPGSMTVVAKLTTTSPNVSPVIDVGRAAITLVSNKVDDPSVSINDTDIDLETMTGGELELTAIQVGSSSDVTVTTSSSHSFYAGQRVEVIFDVAPYSTYSGVHTITAVTSDTIKFTRAGAAQVATTSTTGYVTARSTTIDLSTNIGSAPFIFNETEYSLSTSTNNPQEFSKLNKLKPGHILRFTYDSATGDDYMVVTNKYVYVDNSVNYVAVTLAPETQGSTVTNTGVGEKVDIVWMKNYNSEIGVEIGSVTSKYVTKKINLSRPSEMIRIMLAAALPTGSSIQVFYKTGINAASDDFLNSKYIEVKPANGYTSSEEFIEYTLDVEDLLPYDTMIVKIAMRSSNRASVPRIKDLRVIACAA